MAIKYIEIRAELSWRKIPDIPLVVLPLHASDGYGHIKKWIEENIQNIVYVMIDDKGDIQTTPSGLFTIIETKEILVVFSTEEDYTAFKLMFSEYC